MQPQHLRDGHPLAISCSGDELVWSDFAEPVTRVVATDKLGGTEKILAECRGEVHHIGANRNLVLWSAHDESGSQYGQSLYALRRSDGRIQRVGERGAFCPFASVSDSVLAFTDDAQVFALDESLQPGPLLSEEARLGMATALATDEVNVYWSTSGDTTAPARIYAVPIGGGAPTVSVEATDSAIPCIAAGGGELVWCELKLTRNGQFLGSTLYAQDQSGAVRELTLAGPSPLVRRLRRVDGDFYWREASVAGDGDRILRLRHGETQPVVLVDRLTRGEGFDVDASHIFFGNRALWRLPR